jgi:hypothetical protein
MSGIRLRAASALGAVLLAACSAPQAPPVALPADAPLAGWTATGGMCPEGMCESSLQVRADGTWTRTQAGSQTATGTLADAQLAAVAEATATTGIPRAPAFTGTCPIAYDGQEVVYSWTAPDGTAWRVSACERAIAPDDPLVVALRAVDPGA